MARLVYVVPNVIYMGWWAGTGHVVYVDGERRVLGSWAEVEELTKQNKLYELREVGELRTQ